MNTRSPSWMNRGQSCTSSTMSPLSWYPKHSKYVLQTDSMSQLMLKVRGSVRHRTTSSLDGCVQAREALGGIIITMVRRINNVLDIHILVAIPEKTDSFLQYLHLVLCWLSIFTASIILSVFAVATDMYWLCINQHDVVIDLTVVCTSCS